MQQHQKPQNRYDSVIQDLLYTFDQRTIGDVVCPVVRIHRLSRNQWLEVGMAPLIII